MTPDRFRPKGLPIGENPDKLGDRREAVLAVLDGYREISLKGQLFTLRTPEEIESIIPDVYDLDWRFKENLRPYMRKGHSWVFALSAAIGEAKKKAISEDRLDVWYATRSMVVEEVYDMIRRAAEDTPWVKELEERNWAGEIARIMAWDIVNEATWEVVGDKPGFENNPFSSIRAFHGLGAVLVFFGNVRKPGSDESKQALVIHFPLMPSHDRTPRLACLAFRDIQSRDETDLIVHPLTGPCIRAIP